MISAGPGEAGLKPGDDDMTAYDEMTLPQMTSAWNALVARARAAGSTSYKERGSSFHDRPEGIKRLEALENSVAALEGGAQAAESQPETKTPEAVPQAAESAADTVADSEQETSVAKKTKAKRNTNGHGRKAAGKPAKAVAEFKTVRAGTTRAAVLAAMGGKNTVDEAAEEAGVTRTQLLAHAHCLWRDCGIGYSVDDKGRISASYPGSRTIRDAVVARAE